LIAVALLFRAVIIGVLQYINALGVDILAIGEGSSVKKIDVSAIQPEG